MEKKTVHGTHRWQRFMEGKGFYVALAVCLIAAGGVAAATFGQAMFVSEKKPESPSQTQAAQHPVTNIPDERKTTTAPTVTTTQPTVTSATTAPVPAADLYILPLGNRVQKEYSGGKPVYSATLDEWATHDGVDFAGEKDQAVKALADGKVTEVSDDLFWGETVTVDHGAGVESRYCGVRAGVTEGDTVKVGDSIGTLTVIPCESADGYHLHLQMSVDGEPADPVKVIGLEVCLPQPSESAQPEQ